MVLGTRGELGFGCSPGTDDLPDGIWFGWVDRFGPDALTFDLACLWQDGSHPAAANDSAKIRTIDVRADTRVYVGDDPAVSYADWPATVTRATNAPGLGDTLPFWIFVNAGAATEIVEYPVAVRWAKSATAWPGLVPGCCDGGDIAPPSPFEPWPEAGWPADGFYKAWPEGSPETWIDVGSDDPYEVTISRWLSCSANPGLCPDWWVGDEVLADPDPSARLKRTLPFDEELTVVIVPIFGDEPLVADGPAFGQILAEMRDALDRWLGEDGWTEDPDSPFGTVPWPGETEGGVVGYRGPGGTYLTWDQAWMALEIRNGAPVLYIHAGLVAG